MQPTVIDSFRRARDYPSFLQITVTASMKGKFGEPFTVCRDKLASEEVQ